MYAGQSPGMAAAAAFGIPAIRDAPTAQFM
jgi:hypothetical protein